MLDFFFRGNTALGDPAIAKPNTWILEQGWKDLLFLSSLPLEFKGLAADVVANESTWFDWYNLEVMWALTVTDILRSHPALAPRE